MPYDIRKSDQCPGSKPWGVFKKDGGALIACHATRELAVAQTQAIHVHEGKSYSLAEFNVIRDRIIAAWKEKIDPNGPPDADPTAAIAAEKSAENAAELERKRSDEIGADVERTLQRFNRTFSRLRTA